MTSTRPLVTIGSVRRGLLSPVVIYPTFCAGRTCGNPTAPVHQFPERDRSPVDQAKNLARSISETAEAVGRGCDPAQARVRTDCVASRVHEMGVRKQGGGRHEPN